METPTFNGHRVVFMVLTPKSEATRPGAVVVLERVDRLPTPGGQPVGMLVTAWIGRGGIADVIWDVEWHNGEYRHYYGTEERRHALVASLSSAKQRAKAFGVEI